MRQTAGIILQARFASTRLPGKALQPIDRWTVLEHCLRRLKWSAVAPVVLATTERPDDDPLAALARRLGVQVFRGETDDVLERYVAAARAFNFDLIVRATGDNPATDIDAPGRLLAAIRDGRADYAMEDGLPYGAAVEAVTCEALVRAARQASAPEDREHVTPFVRRNTDSFRVLRLSAPAPLCRPDLRVTVDTQSDLAYVRDLFARTRRQMPTLGQVIQAAGQPVRTGVA